MINQHLCVLCWCASHAQPTSWNRHPWVSSERRTNPPQIRSGGKFEGPRLENTWGTMRQSTEIAATSLQRTTALKITNEHEQSTRQATKLDQQSKKSGADDHFCYLPRLGMQEYIETTSMITCQDVQG